MANKITDINSRYGGASDSANRYNYSFRINDYKQLRTPKLNIKKLFDAQDVQGIPAYLINTYKLQGLEFGNWVNQTRRIDNCLALVISLYDLQKVLKLKNNNLGLNKAVGFAFGARGYAAAFAHYEPKSGVINLTRDRRIDRANGTPYDDVTQNDWNKLTNEMREKLSGYGSIAHEYGHALDYTVASKLKRNFALSGGSQVLYSYENSAVAYRHFLSSIKIGNTEIEKAFVEAFEPFLFRNKKPTSFYANVYKYASQSSTYWSRLNEIWARIFETYIAYKLHKVGIKNLYLVRGGKGKYRDELTKDFLRIYPSFGEMQKHYKKIDKFIQTINKLL